MVIDAAKGIEARTRKLFEICRLRDIPIITFVNKMDREARDPFELLDEVSSTLALDCCARDLAGRPRRRPSSAPTMCGRATCTYPNPWRNRTRACRRWARKWISSAPRIA